MFQPFLKALQRDFASLTGITQSLLHGQWMELLEYLAGEPDPKALVRIIAWDFQQPVLRVRGMLPTKARVGVCRLRAE
ncbi:hypothetical protein [Agathobaculum sp. Marseille-P7918]|uniref:hypothetical protein n=1 Tax=Agathobaculum sp. Marseille-P7918 TaxID=2479843 RepID=UPI00356600C3